MIFEDILRTHLSTIDLDIRKKPLGYSRFMDQKVTPDVLTFIADCVANFINTKNPDSAFNTKEIWNFPYFQKNTMAIFGKPSPTNKKAKSEYDKFIAQPLKTLSFAQILKEEKIGKRNTYQVIQPELLDYISQNERNSMIFIALYVEKVLSDSGFIKEFEVYKTKALSSSVTQADFETLKGKFESFMLGYTEIKKDTEIRRIFPKTLNPYAVYHSINGSEHGKMTKYRFVYSDLMYNRGNFRDLEKNKAITRSEAEQINPEKPEFSIYKIQKAKNLIKRSHTTSEVHDSFAKGEATQVHHIFPEHAFPQIASHVENLILLTPQQHNTRAHPSNHTQLIDKEYQKECLLSKIDTIENSVKQGKDIYSKESLVHVLNIGLSKEMSTNMNFDQLRQIVRETYS